jgi:hypothetical protein
MLYDVCLSVWHNLYALLLFEGICLLFIKKESISLQRAMLEACPQNKNSYNERVSELVRNELTGEEGVRVTVYKNVLI